MAGSQKEPDKVSNKSLALILGGTAALLECFMWLEAQRSGLWREMWVSSIQVLVTAAALFLILRRRD